jgi:cation diffusion facilitator family transporter
MHQTNLATWQHSHAFGLDQRKTGESRTLAVAILTAVTMVVEVVAGLAFGSMALLADGLHMASHATALGIAVLVYVYARRRAGDSRFAFGTGKVNALGGYTSALLLTGFALYMAVESAVRFLAPMPIAFDQAIFVAVVGLLVNGVSVAILGVRHHGDGHDRHGDHYDHRRHDHLHNHHRGHDHNLRGAYLHVLADALTSVLAIVALVAGKYAGAVWLDPAMGLVGALLVGRWAWGLIRDSSQTLLDRQAPAALCNAIRRSIDSCQDTRVADLHVWSIGPGLYAAELAIVSHDPAPPSTYKRLLPEGALAHVTIEVHRCPGNACR